MKPLKIYAKQIKFIKGIPYHSQSQGFVEAFIKRTKSHENLMEKIFSSNNRDMQNVLISSKDHKKSLI